MCVHCVMCIVMYCFKIRYTPSREPWVCVQWSHRLKIARKQISGKSSLIKSAPGSHTIPYLHNLYLDNFQYHAILAPSELANATQPILPFHASYFITLKPYSMLQHNTALCLLEYNVRAMSSQNLPQAISNARD